MKLYDNYKYKLEHTDAGYFMARVAFNDGLFNPISYETLKLNKQYDISKYINYFAFDTCRTIEEAEEKLGIFIKLVCEIDTGDIKKREKEQEGTIHSGTFDDFLLFTI